MASYIKREKVLDLIDELRCVDVARSRRTYADGWDEALVEIKREVESKIPVAADIISLSDIIPEIYGRLTFPEVNALTTALNRLAAYEDTGFSPEEINAMKIELSRLKYT